MISIQADFSHASILVSILNSQTQTISVTVSDRNAFKGATQNKRYSKQFFIFILMLMNRGFFEEIHGWYKCFSQAVKRIGAAMLWTDMESSQSVIYANSASGSCS